MSLQNRQKPIRVGVIGVGRGMSFAQMAGHVDMQLVALCDTWENKLQEAANRFPDIVTYTDYDKFLEHDMDAVILANYFHQHAPFAIKALKAGLHVMSETSACKTLGEAVALIRAVEQSGKTYMLAENYCYFAYNQEMRRLYQQGEIGEIRFAEGEYVHPMSIEDSCRLAPGMNHWRRWLPSTYYCTHALAPIMYITDTRPVCVNALSLPYSQQDQQWPRLRRGDAAATILCRMDNEAITSLQGIHLRGHGNWYRLHGTRGLMENLRTRGEQEKLRIVHDPYDMVEGDVSEKIYIPEFPFLADLARKAGHGGGDFFTSYYFAEAIRTGQPPALDVYRAVDMTIVGIQAWRSCLANGAPQEIPDFRQEAARVRYADDNWSPYPKDQGPGQPPQSIHDYVEPTPEQLAQARSIWQEMGYTGE